MTLVAFLGLDGVRSATEETGELVHDNSVLSNASTLVHLGIQSHDIPRKVSGPGQAPAMPWIRIASSHRLAIQSLEDIRNRIRILNEDDLTFFWRLVANLKKMLYSMTSSWQDMSFGTVYLQRIKAVDHRLVLGSLTFECGIWNGSILARINRSRLIWLETTLFQTDSNQIVLVRISEIFKEMLV